VSATPPAVPASRPFLTPRVLFWSVVLFLGLAAGIGLLLLDRSPRAGTGAVPVADRPAATWAAGLRAPGISLVDQNGAPLSLASYRGRPVVVTFIDPLCRDYCPLEAKHLNEVVRSFPAGSRPAIVAVSVNMLGNSRKNLLEASDKWKVVPQWSWAVGSESQLASVWKKYHVGVLVTSKKVAGVTVHDVVHTEASYVIDAAGYERAIFLWPYSADAVTRTIRALAPSS
jgi:protein SCO1